jgi:predicted RNA polymerase sigma factor
MPPALERGPRLDAVLQVLYLMFTEGHVASVGPELQRDDLAAEAIRLTRALRVALPDDANVEGLLALMLLTHARRASRVSDGELVPLAEQDRSRWDLAMIAEGVSLVERARAEATWALSAAGGDRPGPCRGGGRRGDRLATDPRAVRPPAPA